MIVHNIFERSDYFMKIPVCLFQFLIGIPRTDNFIPGSKPFYPQ